jgi:hypothetical protein
MRFLGADAAVGDDLNRDARIGRKACSPLLCRDDQTGIAVGGMSLCGVAEDTALQCGLETGNSLLGGFRDALIRLITTVCFFES